MIGRNDVTGDRDVKITHFQDHHGDVRSRLRARMPRGRTVSCFLAFFGLFPRLSLSHSFFLSFFFWDWEVSVSFSCLTSLFVCARARAFLFCSGWLLDFPAPFSLLSICHPLRKIHKQRMTSVDCRVISSSHVQFDEMKERLWRSYVRIQAFDGCKSAFEVAPLLKGSKPTAPATLADAKLESTLTNENNKKLRYLIVDLKSTSS